MYVFYDWLLKVLGRERFLLFLSFTLGLLTRAFGQVVQGRRDVGRGEGERKTGKESQGVG